MIGDLNVDGLVVLDGGNAILLLRTAIEQAHKRVWVQQFVIDIRPKADRSGMIRYVLHALSEAVRRGVDVRVLVPEVAPPSGEPYDLNLAAVRFLAARGVAVRRYSGSAERPRHHAKLTIVDDELLVLGNSNWTTRGFLENAEHDVAIRSAQATMSAATKFDWLWSNRAVEPVAEYDPFMLQFRNERPTYWAAHLAYRDPYHRFSRFERRGRAAYGKLLGHPRTGASAQWLHGQRYVREVAAMIGTAKKRVLVAMSAMRATTDRRLSALPEALKAAAHRGVDVRVLYQVRDWPKTDLTADVETLRRSRVKQRPWPADSRMHLRSVIVDDEHVVVGSVGWTPHSIYLCEELSVHVSDLRTAKAFSARFDEWWSLETRWERTGLVWSTPVRSGASSPASNAKARSTFRACTCPCEVCVPDPGGTNISGSHLWASREPKRGSRL